MSSTTDWAFDPAACESDAGNYAKADSRLGQAEPTFVEWTPVVDGPPPRKTPPRLYHRKSRTGCAQCRARRVKCDEIHPLCGNCQRNTGECTYDRQKNSKMNPSSSSLVDRTQPAGTPKSTSSSGKNVEPPAREGSGSRVPRLLELRLLHRYMSETSTTLTVFAGNIEEQKYWWTVAWPRKAFEYDALLNAMYTVTALHWSKLEPDNEEAAEAHKQYLDHALSGHRDDVANLSKQNADAVCLTSAMIRTCIYSGLSTRDLEPYTPPSVWLKSTQASGQVWATSWKWIKDDETSISSALFKATPALMDPALMFHAKNRTDLNYLLHSNPEDDATQLANPDIVRAYETTVSYIGGIKLAIAAGQPKADIFKRLSSFPMWVNRRFTPLVEECQPRALVILCHYFALLTTFKDYWWIGDTGEREIHAVEKFLPPQWLPLMAWPMQVLEEPSVLTYRPKGVLIQSPEDAGAETGSVQSLRGGSADFTIPFGAGFRGERIAS